ncbi:MAG: hypothetical protein ACTSRL_21280 [Candidatus Helarchaeota archaeon]
METQERLLEQFAVENGCTNLVKFRDIASGLNPNYYFSVIFFVNETIRIPFSIHTTHNILRPFEFHFLYTQLIIAGHQKRND